MLDKFIRRSRNTISPALEEALDARPEQASENPLTQSSSSSEHESKTHSIRSPRVLERSEHAISRRNISKAALDVIYQLNHAGYQAYLVGGGIRDLLLGFKPKDFDVATDATPQEIKQLFRRARIVGRRFQIVHVRAGREVIEVTTFRAQHGEESHSTNDSAKNTEGVTSKGGMLLRDNVFGNIEQDALRRDFTVNALYYTVEGFKLLDYVGGLEDLDRRIIRVIGDPAVRYQEDPVRMLRAVRFAAKLGFQLEENSRTEIPRLAHTIGEVSAARLFDEVNKLFLNRSALQCLALCEELGLFQELFPATSALLDIDQAETHEGLQRRILQAALENTAERVVANKPVTPAFIYAALLWARVDNLYRENLNLGSTAQRAMQMASYQALEEQSLITTIPKRFAIAMREIWSLQLSLQGAKNRRALTLLSHPRFRAAYDFLLIREIGGEQLDRSSSFWTDLQEQHPEALQNEQRKKRRSHRSRKRKTPSKHQPM